LRWDGQVVRLPTHCRADHSRLRPGICAVVGIKLLGLSKL
jgi:hypothetical protein